MAALIAGNGAPPEAAKGANQGTNGATAPADSTFARISGRSASSILMTFPVRIPADGAIPLALEILLDRANFSPGAIDGSWGRNAVKALRWFRLANDMDSSAATSIDRVTYDRLVAASQSVALTQTYRVTHEDLAGPFVTIPELVYSQAKLKCLCYTSAAEEIGERFHASSKLLAQLNPRVKLDHLAPGTRLIVPNVRDPAAANPADSLLIARLVISKTGFWTHAVDSAGHIIYHFPSTLGAGYDPSPTGDFKVTDVSSDPAFHYQPKLFHEVPDTKPDAHLPPGPNSPVGVVWISLSKPHYGIHGTSSPETIGYVSSHGCVRLTNWDALKLAEIVEPGTPVEFR
ncbi:MAG TPA: L,D-transpeptidase [Gemmatimonadaceae bacterium]